MTGVQTCALPISLGVTIHSVSQCCRGKQRTCCGHKLEYVKHASENVPSLTKEIRDKNDEIAKLNAIIASMQADAEVGRKIREEQEAKQKAFDEATAEVEKATKKYERRLRVYNNAKAALEHAGERLTDAETEMHNAIRKLEEVKGE